MIACPSHEQLSRLLAEQLDGVERSDLELHVESCPICQQSLERLVADTPGGSGWRTSEVKQPRPRAGGSFLDQLKNSPPPAPGPEGRAEQPNTVATGPIPPTAFEQPAFAGYEILAELGRGGMGIVYKAWQVRLKRPVALKMILDAAHAGPECLARFQTEAEAVARLQHPNVVQIYEVGELAGHPYLALEFVDGDSLARRLAGAPQPARDSALLLQTLARAVHYAHQQGVIHRDLKPANILLASGGRQPPVGASGGRQPPVGASGGRQPPVEGKSEETGGSRPPLAECVPKVADFGLARQLDDGPGQTQTGALMGTPSYMAPEQTTGRTREIGPLADVYALGAILYELLTGRPPFRGATVLDTLEQVRLQEPVPPTRLQPKVPRDLEIICLQCLRKEPHRRYASADELAEDLRRFLAGEPIRARPIGLLERGLKWARRRPAAATLLAVLGLLLLGLIVWDFRGRHWRAVVRADARQSIEAGKESMEREDAQEARLQFSRALTLVSSEPSLADLKAHSQDLLERVRSQLDEAAARQRARDAHQNFLRWRDEAVFHGMLFIGVDLPANLEVTRRAAGDALRLFGATADSEAPLRLSRYYNEREQTEITTGCYELLLILAEAEAREPGEKPARLALQHLDRAAQLGPLTQASHRRRARYLSRLGDKLGAARVSKEADLLAPRTVSDHFLLGDEQYRSGNLPQALSHFDQALALEASHFWSQYFLAVCHLRLGHPAEAKASLTACLGQRPDFFFGYLLRGLAHAGLRATQAAEADFYTQAAEADFQKTLDLNPNSYARYGVYVNRGVLRIEKGKLDEAVEDLQQAVALLPDHFQAHVNLAQAYHRQGKEAEANRAFDQAIQRVPKPAPIFRTRARLALERKELAAALRDLDKAIDLEPPGLSEDHAERGRILHRQNKQVEAIKAYDQAIALAPDHDQVHRWRAEALLELQRYEEALRSYARHLKKGKPDADVYWAVGLLRAKLDQQIEAAEEYTRALALRPSAAIYTDRGWAYLHSEAWKLALRDFEEAVRLDPRYGPAYTGRGYVRVSQGQYRQAADDGEKAARLQPRSPTSTYNLACVFALAAARAQADREQPEREALAQRYRERTLGLLREALDQLPVKQRAAFWREIAPDPDLDPVRASPGFKQLQETYSDKDK